MAYLLYEHVGAMVPGLANRNHHHNLAAGRNTAGWGGVRIKNLLVDEVGRWLHEDAVSAKNSRTLQIIKQLADKCDSSDDKVSEDE